MTLAPYSFEALLQGWRSQLTAWSIDGSLRSAARTALLLPAGPDPEALTGLIGAWSAEDFSGLPPIEVLDGSVLPGAAGAYAISTGKIYLNGDWVATASEQQVIAVLTEELGHHLDGLLNVSDTPGDEGILFSSLLSAPDAHNPLSHQLAEDDNIKITLDSGYVDVELSGIPAVVATTLIDLSVIKIFSRDGMPIDNRETVVLFHGWGGPLAFSGYSGWFDDNLSNLRDIAEKFPASSQVLLVDWSAAALSLGLPILAAGNIRQIANYVASKLSNISSSITLIGHSLGGIMAGEVGKYLGASSADIVTLDVAAGSQAYDLELGNLSLDFAERLDDVSRYSLAVVNADIDNLGLWGDNDYSGTADTSLLIRYLNPINSGAAHSDVQGVYSFMLGWLPANSPFYSSLFKRGLDPFDIAFPVNQFNNNGVQDPNGLHEGVILVSAGNKVLSIEGYGRSILFVDDGAFYFNLDTGGRIFASSSLSGSFEFRAGSYLLDSYGIDYTQGSQISVTGGDVTWTGGSLRDLNVGENGVLTIEDSYSNGELLGVINNQGIVNFNRLGWPAAFFPSISFGNQTESVKSNNIGTVNSNGSIYVLPRQGATNNSLFSNSGTFNNLGYTRFGIEFTNSGSVINASQLEFYAAFSSTGTIDSKQGYLGFYSDVSTHGKIETESLAPGTGSGSGVYFRSGVHSFNADAQFTGNQFFVEGATITGDWQNELIFKYGVIRDLDIQDSGIINIEDSFSGGELLGIINNRGVVNLNRLGWPSTFFSGITFGSLTDSVTFNNIGTVNSSGSNFVLTKQGATNNSLFSNSGTFNNLGFISFGIEFTNSGSVVNSGSLQFYANYIQFSGITRIEEGASFSFSSDVQLLLNGGVLAGGGYIWGDVESFAAINPGDAIGSLDILGNFSQAGSGVVNIDIGGLGLDNYDRLVIGGVASLDGAINITLVNGFVPKIGDSFEIISFDSLANSSIAYSGLTIRAPRIISSLQGLCGHEKAAEEAAEQENFIPTIDDIA